MRVGVLQDERLGVQHLSLMDCTGVGEKPEHRIKSRLTAQEKKKAQNSCNVSPDDFPSITYARNIRYHTTSTVTAVPIYKHRHFPLLGLDDRISNVNC